MITKPSQRPLSTPALSLFAYTIACSGSWIEHGPTITSSLSSEPLMTCAASLRLVAIVRCDAADTGRSWRSSAGGISGSYCSDQRRHRRGRSRPLTPVTLLSSRCSGGGDEDVAAAILLLISAAAVRLLRLQLGSDSKDGLIRVPPGTGNDVAG
jgi:hypothetical protein